MHADCTSDNKCRHLVLSTYQCGACMVMYTNVNAVSTTTRSLSLTCCTDVTDDGGETPLDYAVQKGHTEVSEYLKSVRKPSTPEPGMCVCQLIVCT